MDLIQLKMPPGKLAALIASVERDLKRDLPQADRDELQGILYWFRHRLIRWKTTHPHVPAR